MFRCHRSPSLNIPVLSGSASLFTVALLASSSLAARAQVVVAPLQPQIGTSQPAPPEPPVARPSTTPCTVQLFSNLPFNDYGTRPLTYTPTCTGPWSKVILTADLTVTAGRQFDRTARIFLGGANLYFGTTVEPRAALSPSWHVERDITDYSALLTAPQTGIASIQNVVNSTYNGMIYGSATLLFYPADAKNPAHKVPSAVIGFPSNDITSLNTGSDKATITTTFPRNLERLELDVVSQSQQNDEQWFLNVPDAYASQIGFSGGTAFRETEVTIDGAPAGVAPIYPWIYTGGIDPYLWEPIPGVQTLNLKPYRVNLTPFAGQLADGQPHTVSVSVFNADNRFDVATSLLLYTGPVGSITTGFVTSNSLSAAPTPQIEAYLNTAADGTLSGPISTQNFRQWTIAGYTQNSADGRVDTSIQASNTFKNVQNDLGSNTRFQSTLQQETTQQEIITTVAKSGTTTTQRNIDWPINVTYTQAPNDNNDGGFYIASAVSQGLYDVFHSPIGANSPYPVVTSERVQTSDTLHYNAAGAFIGHDNNASQSFFGSKDAQQRCVSRSQSSNQLILTSSNTDTSCTLVP